MPRTGWSPSMVPDGADEMVCLIIDRFSPGTVYRETEIERTDLEAIISDLLIDQFNDPVRGFAFNTLEHAAADVAVEIQSLCDIQGEPVPDHLSDFVRSYSGSNRQLTFRLA
jgi:hypothetical protein